MFGFLKKSLGAKFIVSMVLVAVVPMAVIAGLASWYASEALEAEAINQLIGTREGKRLTTIREMERIAQEMKGLLNLKRMLESYDHMAAVMPAKGAGALDTSSQAYKSAWRG